MEHIRDGQVGRRTASQLLGLTIFSSGHHEPDVPRVYPGLDMEVIICYS